MVGLDGETAVAAFAILMFLVGMFGLTGGDVQLAGISFFVVALLIYTRETRFKQ